MELLFQLESVFNNCTCTVFNILFMAFSTHEWGTTQFPHTPVEGTLILYELGVESERDNLQRISQINDGTSHRQTQTRVT